MSKQLIIFYFTFFLLIYHSKAQNYNVPKGTVLHIFTADMQKALITTKAGEVQLWDFEQQKSQKIMPISRKIQLAAFSPDGSLLAFNIRGTEVLIWHIINSKLLTKFNTPKTDILCLAFSSNGKFVATGTQDQRVILWDKTGKQLKQWEVSDFPIRALSFSNDDELIATGGVDKLIKIWNLKGNLHQTLTGHNSSITALCFSRDKQKIYSISEDKILKVWHVDGKEISSSPINFIPTHVMLDKNQNVVIWNSSGELKVINPNLLLQAKNTPNKILTSQRKITNRNSNVKNYTEVIDSISFNMIWVDGGRFTIGCTNEQGIDCEDNELKTRNLIMPDYYIAETEVTQSLWRAVMGNNPDELHNINCDECPVDNLSIEDIDKFIRKLNEYTGKEYTIPTEAQWEYAARGGVASKSYKYSGSNDIDEVAWYYDNFRDVKYGEQGSTHPVKTKQPNELGLYDMSGNVWEWCKDWYTQDYKNYPVDKGIFYVVRGGGWRIGKEFCRVSYRSYFIPSYRRDSIGVRLAHKSK